MTPPVLEEQHSGVFREAIFNQQLSCMPAAESVRGLNPYATGG